MPLGQPLVNESHLRWRKRREGQGKRLVPFIIPWDINAWNESPPSRGLKPPLQMFEVQVHHICIHGYELKSRLKPPNQVRMWASPPAVLEI